MKHCNFIILLVIFLGLVTASVMSYVYRTDIRQKVKKGLDRGFHSYGTNDTNEWNEEIDYMQQQVTYLIDSYIQYVGPIDR